MVQGSGNNAFQESCGNILILVDNVNVTLSVYCRTAAGPSTTARCRSTTSPTTTAI
jgi:hypothetical protein